jgi:hypothetical protein
MDKKTVTDAQRVVDCMQEVSKVLKKRFPNLTVEQTIGISGEILNALENVLEGTTLGVGGGEVPPGKRETDG